MTGAESDAARDETGKDGPDEPVPRGDPDAVETPAPPPDGARQLLSLDAYYRHYERLLEGGSVLDGSFWGLVAALGTGIVAAPAAGFWPGVGIALVAGALTGGLVWDLSPRLHGPLFRWMLRRRHRGDPKVVGPIPEGGFDHAVAWCYSLSSRRPVPGTLYVAPGRLAFVPYATPFSNAPPVEHHRTGPASLGTGEAPADLGWLDRRRLAGYRRLSFVTDDGSLDFLVVDPEAVAGALADRLPAAFRAVERIDVERP